MSNESVTEADISATFDDIELDALMSLLDEDSVFQGLHKLPLFAPGASPVQPCNAPDSEEVGQEFDDLFQDALEFVCLPTQSKPDALSVETGKGEDVANLADLSVLYGCPTTQGISQSLFQQLSVETLQALRDSSSQPPAHQPLLSGYSTSSGTAAVVEAAQPDVSCSNNLSSRLTPVLDPSTGICLDNIEPATVGSSPSAQTAAINHDHCYTALSELGLSSPSELGVSRTGASGRNSEADEGNSSDGGKK